MRPIALPVGSSEGIRPHIVRKLVIGEEKPMPELSHIDPRSAALLVMDYQVDTLTKFMTAAQSVIAKQAAVVTMAELAGALPSRSS
jgi:hypothetical protein